MYAWLLFLHIGAVILFSFAHGSHMAVMWKWRGAEDPAVGLSLFNGLPRVRATRILLVVAIATGILLAVIGDWWRQLWVWLSLGVLGVMWAAMWRWGGSYFGLVQDAARKVLDERGDGSDATAALDAYRAVRLGWQPTGLMIIGVGGLAVVLWLMIFKPF